MDSDENPPRVEEGLIPARMLNEVTYCPRLYWLEHVAGEWAESADTVEGKRVHHRVDRGTGTLPDAQWLEDAKIHARSVTVSSVAEGVIAKVDLIEAEDGMVVPVDYKRGELPDPEKVPFGAWPADRVQVAAQMVALRENGYRCDHGVLYYAASKTRVPVTLDDELLAQMRAAVELARKLASETVPPAPLDGSPKCPRCSLAPICLPDETVALLHGDQGEPARPRQLVPALDEKLALYVQTPGSVVGKSGDCLEVRTPDGKKNSVPLRDTSQVCLFGAAQLTCQAMHEVCSRGIPVSLFSHGGWHFGWVGSFPAHNALLRVAQFRTAQDAKACLKLAQKFTEGKILNCRTLLRRNGDDVSADTLQRLKELANQALEVTSDESLLGVEGTAARLYFEGFATLLKPRSGAKACFDFHGRNRRPPRDPVNALLSFAYALLVKDVRLALAAAGFDWTVGFYHKIRPGRPALALDLMEEFRPLIADSVVLTAVNTEVVQTDDFIHAGGAVAMGEKARKAFIAAYERRMEQEITHPMFGYQVSYRRILEVQARLLGRTIMGELSEYPGFRTR